MRVKTQRRSSSSIVEDARFKSCLALRMCRFSLENHWQIIFIVTVCKESTKDASPFPDFRHYPTHVFQHSSLPCPYAQSCYNTSTRGIFQTRIVHLFTAFPAGGRDSRSRSFVETVNGGGAANGCFQK